MKDVKNVFNIFELIMICRAKKGSMFANVFAYASFTYILCCKNVCINSGTMRTQTKISYIAI